MTSGLTELAPFRRALRRVAPQLSRPLPWIGHADPWAVLVSEFMLQQTQTSRVIEPWQRFLEMFPTPAACANAQLSAVLVAWEGLGYHRRAKALRDAATMITNEFHGVVPCDVDDLLRLPGVGAYTARAIASFAYGKRVAVLDTNVGRVLARAVAGRPLGAAEAQTLANDLLPRDGVATFNQALLDLGAQFCKSVPRCVDCPVRKVCVWQRDGGDDPAVNSAGVSKPQSTFQGSKRQLRGIVLRELRRSPRTRRQLLAALGSNRGSVRSDVLASLEHDGLIVRTLKQYSLADS